MYSLKRTILHELVHSLGVYHMHQRTDRDKYVKINSENLGNDFQKDYMIAPNSVLLGVPYDPKSLMHYFAHDGSKNGKPVMESKVIYGQLYFIFLKHFWK